VAKRRAHYVVRIANAICEKIALGNTLKQALYEVGPLAPTMPMFWRWINEYPEFKDNYERARQMQGDIHADQMLELAQDALRTPSKATAIRVATDILKWQAEIRDPKRYGPKLQHEVKEAPLSADKLKDEIRKLEADLGVKAVPGMNTSPNFVRRDDRVDPASPGEPAPPPNCTPATPPPPSESHGTAHLLLDAPEALQ
jgi:terminase small subunit-like protein